MCCELGGGVLCPWCAAQAAMPESGVGQRDLFPDSQKKDCLH